MLRRDHPPKVPRHAYRRLGRVLVVDGDAERAGVLCAALKDDGHDVTVEATVAGGAHVAMTTVPDLIVLDADREEGLGLSVCAALRREHETREVLVLVMSSSASEATRVEAFEAGADDYMARPFSTRELLLRARALLRRVARARVTGP